MNETLDKLRQLQNLSLDGKVKATQTVVDKWWGWWNGSVYVSFSGGKDSTVLRDVVSTVFPDVVSVFCNTGLEFPETNRFVRTKKNVTIIRPSMPFQKVIDRYGFPVISKESAQKIEEIRNTKSDKLRSKRIYGDSNGNGKLPDKWRFMIDAPFKISHRCCNELKKKPFKLYEKQTGNKPMVGTMVGDSRLRGTAYIKKGGCNAFDTSRPMSTPLAFWSEADVWTYIDRNKIEISPIYKERKWRQTGCMFCMFGLEQDDNPNRFHKIKESHPKHYDLCINKLGLGKVLDFMGYDYEHEQLDLFR